MDKKITTNELLVQILEELKEIKIAIKINTREISSLSGELAEELADYFYDEDNDNCDCDLCNPDKDDDKEKIVVSPSEENCSDCENYDCTFNPLHEKIINPEECEDCDDITCPLHPEHNPEEEYNNEEEDDFDPDREKLAAIISFLLDEYEKKYTDK